MKRDWDYMDLIKRSAGSGANWKNPWRPSAADILAAAEDRDVLAGIDISSG